MENIIYNILVIGAGGTGSYFLKEFARFLSNSVNSSKVNGLYIADGDIVESKNLSRQNFFDDDISLKKSTAMASLIHDSFNLEFKSYPQYITDKETIAELIGNKDIKKDCVRIPVIISCVDNHGARLVIEDYFNSVENCIVMDSANEYDTGQCVFSVKLAGEVLSPTRSHYFPEILQEDTRQVTEMSCTELNEVSPQHIVTNMLAGLQLLSAMTQLIENNKLTRGVSYFNSMSLSNTFVESTKFDFSILDVLRQNNVEKKVGA